MMLIKAMMRSSLWFLRDAKRNLTPPVSAGRSGHCFREKWVICVKRIQTHTHMQRGRNAAQLFCRKKKEKITRFKMALKASISLQYVVYDLHVVTRASERVNGKSWVCSTNRNQKHVDTCNSLRGAADTAFTQRQQPAASVACCVWRRVWPQHPVWVSLLSLLHRCFITERRFQHHVSCWKMFTPTLSSSL